MSSSESMLKIELNLDPGTRWSLLPRRLPGKIEGPDPNYARGAIISPLVQFFGPNGREVRTVKSREGGELSPGALVEFSLRAKRGKSGSTDQIEAVNLSPISTERERELQEAYKEQIFNEVADRLGEQLPALQRRVSEIESQIETEVGRRIEARTKELRQQEHELRAEKRSLKLQEGRIKTEREALEAEKAQLAQQWERWEKEGAAAWRYYEWGLSQHQRTAELQLNTSVEQLAPDAQPPENWIDKLYERLEERSFVIGRSTFNQFLASVLCAVAFGDFVILAGPPGIGKTSVVEQIAPMIGSGSAVIPVRPAWTDSTDLFGFFNPVHRVYQPTPFVEHLLSAKRYADANRLYMLCLDEANLARIENYAADLLVKMEKSRLGEGKVILYTRSIAQSLGSECAELIKMADRWTPKQAARVALLEGMEPYPPELDLPLNLAMLGTVNVDETTYSLSPKVLDRAFVVQFLAADWSKIVHGSDKQPENKVSLPVPVNWVRRLAEMDWSEEVTKEVGELWKILSRWQVAYLNPLGLDCGYRLATSFSQFMRMSIHGLSLEPKQAASAFAQMKILPRLAFIQKEPAAGQSGRQKIEIYGQWCEDRSLKSFPGLEDMLKAIDERSKHLPVLQFWR